MSKLNPAAAPFVVPASARASARATPPAAKTTLNPTAMPFVARATTPAAVPAAVSATVAAVTTAADADDKLLGELQGRAADDRYYFIAAAKDFISAWLDQQVSTVKPMSASQLSVKKLQLLMLKGAECKDGSASAVAGVVGVPAAVSTTQPCSNCRRKREYACRALRIYVLAASPDPFIADLALMAELRDAGAAVGTDMEALVKDKLTALSFPDMPRDVPLRTFTKFVQTYV